MQNKTHYLANYKKFQIINFSWGNTYYYPLKSDWNKTIKGPAIRSLQTAMFIWIFFHIYSTDNECMGDDNELVTILDNLCMMIIDNYVQCINL